MDLSGPNRHHRQMLIHNWLRTIGHGFAWTILLAIFLFAGPGARAADDEPEVVDEIQAPATKPEVTKRVFQHEAAVTTIDITRNGNVAVTGSSDGYIRLWEVSTGRLLSRHSPDDIQICGRRTTDPPPWELRTLRSPPMRRLWRADQVRNAIWQSIPPSRRTSPIVFTSPLISSAYAGTGLGRRSSIKPKIFWNKLLGTATSANWNVTYRP